MYIHYMDYVIPDNIKMLCAKIDLSDADEQDAVKKELVKFLEYYLDLKKGKNSLANISGIVHREFPVKGTNYPFERDVAGRMVRTHNYIMKEVSRKVGDKEIWEVLVIPLDRRWWEIYPYLIPLIAVLVGSLLTLIATKIAQPKKQLYNQSKSQSIQNRPFQNDSLKNLQIQKMDSASH